MTKEMMGNVVAVCMSDKHGFPTVPQEMVTIGMLGIDGDAHSGEMRASFTQKGTLKPNDRPISIVSNEVRELLIEVCGYNMEFGDFNEQIVVEGLGDMGDFSVGTVLTFEGGVMLEVLDHAYPCLELEKHNGKGLMKDLLIPSKAQNGKPYSMRGILCKVLSPGDLRAGNGVVATLQEEI
jgi:hypothetical protein